MKGKNRNKRKAPTVPRNLSLGIVTRKIGASHGIELFTTNNNQLYGMYFTDMWITKHNLADLTSSQELSSVQTLFSEYTIKSVKLWLVSYSYVYDEDEKASLMSPIHYSLPWYSDTVPGGGDTTNGNELMRCAGVKLTNLRSLDFSGKRLIDAYRPRVSMAEGTFKADIWLPTQAPTVHWFGQANAVGCSIPITKSGKLPGGPRCKIVMHQEVVIQFRGLS